MNTSYLKCHVAGWIMSPLPPGTHIQILKSAKGFPSAAKGVCRCEYFKGLEVGRWGRLPRWAPCHLQCPYKSGAVASEAGREDNVTTEGRRERRGDVLRGPKQGLRAVSRTFVKQRNGLSREPPEETVFADILTLAQSMFLTWEIIISDVKFLTSSVVR